MVYDSIDNLIKHTPEFLPRAAEFTKFLELTKTMGFEELREISDKFPFRLCFNEYETMPPETVPLEAHRKFWDLQVVLEGEELMGYAPLDEMTETVPYEEQEDIAFYSGEAQTVRIGKGMAVLLAPWDGHQPGLMIGAPAKVKKIVIKLDW